jgi:hypothetical protein
MRLHRLQRILFGAARPMNVARNLVRFDHLGGARSDADQSHTRVPVQIVKRRVIGDDAAVLKNAKSSVRTSSTARAPDGSASNESRKTENSTIRGSARHASSSPKSRNCTGNGWT